MIYIATSTITPVYHISFSLRERTYDELIDNKFVNNSKSGTLCGSHNYISRISAYSRNRSLNEFNRKMFDETKAHWCKKCLRTVVRMADLYNYIFIEMI